MHRIEIKVPETVDDCDILDCADCVFQYSTEYWLCKKVIDEAKQQRLRSDEI